MMINNSPPPSYGAMEGPPNYEEIFGEGPEIAIEMPSQNGFSTNSQQIQIQALVTFLERRAVERGRQRRFGYLMALLIGFSFFLILLYTFSGGNILTMFRGMLIFVAVVLLLLCLCNCFE